MNVCVSTFFCVGLMKLLSVNTDAHRSVCLLYEISACLCIVGLRPAAPVPCEWQAGLYFTLFEYASPPGTIDKECVFFFFLNTPLHLYTQPQTEI